MWNRIVAACAILVLASACGDGGSSSAVERTVDPIPTPTDAVVLTIAGEVASPNVGAEVLADLAGLESLGTVEVVVYEPFVSEEITFTGVPLETVLRAAGIESDTELTWTALDDYQVHYSLAELAGEGAMLATRHNGAPIGIADGGPIRVVFTEVGGDLGRNSNEWIWSLARVDAG